MIKKVKSPRRLLDEIRKPIGKPGQVIKSKKRRIEREEHEKEIKEYLN